MQGRAVSNAAECRQYLRDSIVGEHGDFIDIPESAVAFSVEAAPYVCYQDLGALEEADGLASALELELISETGEITCEQVDQSSRRSVGGFDAVDEAAVVLLQEAALCVGWCVRLSGIAV